MSSLNTIVVFVVFVGIQNANSQFDVEIQKSAWERTSYEHWDEFNPWTYFKFVHKKYDDEDRRTMHTRAKQMALWAVYRDDYEFYLKKTDSLFDNETYKALDRVLNKNWLLFQKGRAQAINKDLDEILEGAATTIPVEVLLSLDKKIEEIRENIDICVDSYVSDSKKTPLIEKYLKQLTELLHISTVLDEFFKVYKIIDTEVEPIEIEPLIIQPLN